jgi:hypothetical protein
MPDQITLEGRALPICPYGLDKKPRLGRRNMPSQIICGF